MSSSGSPHHSDVCVQKQLQTIYIQWPWPDRCSYKYSRVDSSGSTILRNMIQNFDFLAKDKE